MSGFNLGEFMAGLRKASGKARQDAAKAKSMLPRGRPVRVARAPGQRAARRAGSSTGRDMTHTLGYSKMKGGQAGDAYMIKKGRLVATNMMGSNPTDRRLEFGLDQARHPRTRSDRMVIHSVLSLPPAKRMIDSEWRAVVDAWRDKVGADGSFVAAVHNDTESQHVHLIWSRANRDGSLVNMSQDFRRHREAAHQAADQLLGGRETPRDSNTPSPPTTRAVSAQRRAIRRDTPDPWLDPVQIKEVLSRSPNSEAFGQNLAKVGIEIRPAMRPSDGQIVGLLFRQSGADEWLAGSSISREFSLQRIQAQFELRQKELRKRDQEIHIQRQRQAFEQQRQQAIQSQQVARPRNG